MEPTRNNFKMGTLEMLVLSLLNHKDLYGYEISLLLKELSGGSYSVPEGSLYPVLYKLEDNKFITAHTVKAGKRRVRKVYHIEPDGKNRLEFLLSEYRSTANGIELILGAEFSEYKEGEQ